jgi:uncharacterized protein YaaQ
MILRLVIVQPEDVAKLSERLLEDGFRLTRINSAGGFLAAGSSVAQLSHRGQAGQAIMATEHATIGAV